MKPLRQYNKDRVSGVVLLVLGLAIVAQGLEYRMGALTRMGAGFIPVVLGTLAGAGRRGDLADRRARRLRHRRRACPPSGAAGSACSAACSPSSSSASTAGLVPATFLSVFIAALGDRGNSVRVAALLAAGITVAGVLIFVYGLSMTFPLFTWG